MPQNYFITYRPLNYNSAYLNRFIDWLRLHECQLIKLTVMEENSNHIHEEKEFNHFHMLISVNWEKSMESLKRSWYYYEEHELEIPKYERKVAWKWETIVVGDVYETLGYIYKTVSDIKNKCWKDCASEFFNIEEMPNEVLISALKHASAKALGKHNTKMENMKPLLWALAIMESHILDNIVDCVNNDKYGNPYLTDPAKLAILKWESDNFKFCMQQKMALSTLKQLIEINLVKKSTLSHVLCSSENAYQGSTTDEDLL